MSLKFYLDNHHGKRRHMIWAKAEVDEGKESQAVMRIAGADGLFENSSIEHMKAGESYRFRLSNDEVLEGKALRVLPQGKSEFAGAIRNLNNGLFRIGTGTKYMFLWLALYDMPEPKVKQLKDKLKTRFGEMFERTSVGLA